MLSPVVLFVYNRFEHTKKTIEALQQNYLAEDTELFIFSDYYKNEDDKKAVESIRAYINSLKGFKSVNVIERSKNFGLGKSVIDGVTYVISKYGKVIVLEDDLITHVDFLKYMNRMLNLYQDEKKVYSISGYSIPALSSVNDDDYFFVPRISSWGWGCWVDRWNSVDWKINGYNELLKDKAAKKKFNTAGGDMLDMLIHQVEGESESWAIRFDYNRFINNNSLTIYPRFSFINNIGMDGSGVHKEKSSRFDNMFIENNHSIKDFIKKNEPLVNEKVIEEFRKVYTRSYKSFFLIYIRRYAFYKYYKKMYKRILRSIR